MENQREKLLYEKESYKIRGVCFNVFNTLGSGIREKIIVRALTKELKDKELIVEQQVRIDVVYNNEKIGVYIPDLIINKKIIVELKSKPYLTKEDLKQFWGYLKGSPYRLGFLVLFGPERLLIKRFIHTSKTAESV